VEVETKYIRSMKLLDSIRLGEGIEEEIKDDRLLDNLVRKGFIIRRPGRRNWATDSYDLTIKAEKTLEEYKKMWGVRGGSRPSAGHRGR